MGGGGGGPGTPPPPRISILHISRPVHRHLNGIALNGDLIAVYSDIIFRTNLQITFPTPTTKLEKKSIALLIYLFSVSPCGAGRIWYWRGEPFHCCVVCPDTHSVSLKNPHWLPEIIEWHRIRKKNQEQKSKKKVGVIPKGGAPLLLLVWQRLRLLGTFLRDAAQLNMCSLPRYSFSVFKESSLTAWNHYVCVFRERLLFMGGESVEKGEGQKFSTNRVGGISLQANWGSGNFRKPSWPHYNYMLGGLGGGDVDYSQVTRGKDRINPKGPRGGVEVFPNPLPVTNT